MQNLIRFVLLLGIAASAITALASAVAWWMEEERRLNRIVNRVLGGPADGCIVAKGRNAAAGFRLSTGKIVVMREGGARAVLYPMGLLVGAELLVDDQVVGRTLRNEPRRPLDQIAASAKKVVLRLLFDDATHPDFNLELWLPQDQLRRDAQPPAAAIVEGRAWLGRAEALLRKPANPVLHLTPAEEPLRKPAAAEVEDAAEIEVDAEDEDDTEVVSGKPDQPRLL
jgi:hypothetical protein